MKKIAILNDNYEDNKSKKIIEEINKMVTNDEKYSETEVKLLKLCREKNLIDTYFYEKAENLRKVRNHCAHPAFDLKELYIPSKSETYMYLDFVYNCLLKINAINYYDAVNFVLDDIKEAYEKGFSCNKKGLRTKACRLYSKFDNKNRQKVFNSLFELSIIKNNDDCKKYRDYTYNYMLWLSEFLKDKNIILDHSIVKKIKISHLDRDFFGSNSYISRIIVDNIISLKDIESYNSEMYDLFKQFLIDSDNLYEMYIQIFGGFSEYVEYLINECDNWRIIYSTICYVDDAKLKPYFAKLLKKLVILTPKVNGFDRSDACIELFIENKSELIEQEKNDIFSIMIDNNQFFNSSKRKNEENKKKIGEMFGKDFQNLYDDMMISKLPEPDLF